MLMLPTGEPSGPLTIEPTEIAHKHTVTGLPRGCETLISSGASATPYVFGPASKSVYIVRVTSITPNDRNTITISGDVVNADVYDLSGTAPEPGSGVGAPPLAAISIYIYESNSTSQQLTLSWSGSAAAFKVEYLVAAYRDWET